MKINKRIKSFILIIILFMTLGIPTVYANSIIIDANPIEYTEEYKRYLELSDEERKEALEPRSFKVLKNERDTKNPLYLIKEYGSELGAIESRFSLFEIIPNNMVVKNQMNQDTCWAFNGLAALETNLAIANNDSKVYDFSERHVDYSTVRFFKNNTINPLGFRKSPGGTGSWNAFETYLTLGLGAIPESEMPFENNRDLIDIDDIKNKTVSTQVYDTIYLENTGSEENRYKIKEHIKEHGAVAVAISSAANYTDCYNRNTGAYYCDDSQKYPVDHAVAIVGWDDDYSIENFSSTHRPSAPGAWIIKNSWGSDVLIEGYMYVSYEDKNIYTDVNGILRASEEINYENLYRYNNHGSCISSALIKTNKNQKIYLANVFSKQTNNKEFLTQVAISSPETYTCKVYINPNNSDKDSINKFQAVKLKNGETQTIEAGYHTLEFLEPVEITGNNFVVVIEVSNTRDDRINILGDGKISTPNSSNFVYGETVVEKGRCFVSVGSTMEEGGWVDLAELTTINTNYIDMNSTINAFTISEVEDNSLNSIEIKTEPTKTKYIENENFDKTGMVVIAKYNNGTITEITDYNITDGTNLKEGQTSVTISYQDKEVKQNITVEKKEENTPTVPEEKDEIEKANFNNVKCKVKSLKYYTYTTDSSNRNYVLIDVEISDISISDKNDKNEYYYYLSANQNETNISNWIKIENVKTPSNKITFTINSKEVPNIKDLIEVDKLYLYIEEVATKGGEQATTISKAMLVEESNNKETYLDGKKVDPNNNNNNNNKPGNNISNNQKPGNNVIDDTISKDPIPFTGKSLFIILLIVVSIISLVLFIKYEELNRYVK